MVTFECTAVSPLLLLSDSNRKRYRSDCALRGCADRKINRQRLRYLALALWWLARTRARSAPSCQQKQSQRSGGQVAHFVPSRVADASREQGDNTEPKARRQSGAIQRRRRA